MLPENIGDDPCRLSARWLLDPAFARDLVRLNAWSMERFARAGVRSLSLRIISGHRSQALQAEVNPDAPLSLHTRCPAVAADLALGESDPRFTSPQVWAILGGRWKLTTLGRWGGNFCRDTLGIGICTEGGQSGAINTAEMNHFDLGVGIDIRP